MQHPLMTKLRQTKQEPQTPAVKPLTDEERRRVDAVTIQETIKGRPVIRRSRHTDKGL